MNHPETWINDSIDSYSRAREHKARFPPAIQSLRRDGVTKLDRIGLTSEIAELENGFH